MGNEWCRIDLTFGYQAKNLCTVASVYTTGLESQVLSIHPRQRQYLLLLIESDNRDDGIRSGTTPCQFKGVLASGNLNDTVGATTVVVGWGVSMSHRAAPTTPPAMPLRNWLVPDDWAGAVVVIGTRGGAGGSGATGGR